VLEVEILRHGLDHDVDVLQLLEGGGEVEAPARGVALLRGQLPLFHRPADALLDRAPTLLAVLVAHLADPGLVPGARGHLRDPAPHESASKHGNPTDLGHISSPGFSSSPDETGGNMGASPGRINASRGTTVRARRRAGDANPWEAGRAAPRAPADRGALRPRRGPRSPSCGNGRVRSRYRR